MTTSPTRGAATVGGNSLDQHQTSSIRLHGDEQDPKIWQRGQLCRRSITASGSLRRTAPAPTACRGHESQITSRPRSCARPTNGHTRRFSVKCPKRNNPCKSALDEDNTDMTTPTFRYGRRPPKNAPALRLAPLLTGVLPAPASHVDYGTDFTGWQMLGNDVAGDCVAVTWANQRALVTTALSHKTDYPSQSEVWTFYQTQNPNFNPNGSATSNGPGSPADGGMDIQTALEYAVNHGGPDGVKAVAFAAVDYTNENELRSAHAIFGQVWYGINVLIANQTEFSNGQPWDYVAGSPLDGGHSITGIGYDPTDYRFVTWAQETEWTEAFRTHQVEEAWVVIWPEHLGTTEFEQGMNLKQLAADYQAITGNTLNLPQPPQRIGVLTTAGDALVKQGALNAAWVTEYSGVTQLAVTDNRVAVLTTAGDALVKEGGLSAAWVTEYSGVSEVGIG